MMKRSLFLFVVGVGLLILAGAGASFNDASEPVRVDGQWRAWLPWWDFDNAAAQATTTDFDELVLFAWVLNEHGGIEMRLDDFPGQVRQLDKASPARLVAGIYNEFDGERVSRMLHDRAVRERHVDDLITKVRVLGLDGLELDYEYLAEEDKQAYVAFVEQLAGGLHAEGKTLAVTVHAKTSDAGDWHGAAAQDWSKLAIAADQLVIMAYDFHWEESEAGSIAPEAWVDEVLQYAEEELDDLSRVVLGAGAYGYDWTEGEERARDMTLAEIEEIEVDETEIEVRDGQGRRLVYEDDDGREHTVWFEGAQNIFGKVEMANKFGTGGVSLWRLGGVPAGVLDLVSAYD